MSLCRIYDGFYDQFMSSPLWWSQLAPQVMVLENRRSWWTNWPMIWMSWCDWCKKAPLSGVVDSWSNPGETVIPNKWDIWPPPTAQIEKRFSNKILDRKTGKFFCFSFHKYCLPELFFELQTFFLVERNPLSTRLQPATTGINRQTSLESVASTHWTTA